MESLLKWYLINMAPSLTLEDEKPSLKEKAENEKNVKNDKIKNTQVFNSSNFN